MTPIQKQAHRARMLRLMTIAEAGLLETIPQDALDAELKRAEDSVLRPGVELMSPNPERKI